eukprot:3940311-Rhodomonas_salina.3
MSGTALVYGAMGLCHVWYGHSISMVLPACVLLLYAVCGTGMADGAIGLCTFYALSGTEAAYGATSPVRAAISLRACYAMSGTEIVYGAIGLRAHYAMSGTDVACGVMVPLRPCYAMSGTDAAYDPTRIKWSLQSGSAFFGTDIHFTPKGTTGFDAMSVRCPGLTYDIAPDGPTVFLCDVCTDIRCSATRLVKDPYSPIAYPGSIYPMVLCLPYEMSGTEKEILWY